MFFYKERCAEIRWGFCFLFGVIDESCLLIFYMNFYVLWCGIFINGGFNKLLLIFSVQRSWL